MLLLMSKILKTIGVCVCVCVYVYKAWNFAMSLVHQIDLLSVGHTTSKFQQGNVCIQVTIAYLLMKVNHFISTNSSAYV